MSEDQVTATAVEDEVEDRPISIFDICETDTEAEENGRWFRDVFEDGSNIHLKLRRMTSTASIQARRRLDRIYRKQMNAKGEYDETTGMKVLVEQLAGGVIVDWENINGRDGKPIEYSEKAAVDLMTKLPSFRDTVIVCAQNIEGFRIEESGEAEKN